MPSLGQATLGTLESRVSPDLLAQSAALFTTTPARMCYAYQQMNDIGTFGATSTRGYLKCPHVHRYREKHLPEYHAGGAASGSVLAQAGAKLSKGWPATVGVH